jgi:hypothetical protein
MILCIIKTLSYDKPNYVQIGTVRRIAGMNRTEWVENADRLVAGFLEMFEEGCHKMVGSLFPP